MTDSQFLSYAIGIADKDGRFRYADVFEHFKVAGSAYDYDLPARLHGLITAPYGNEWHLIGAAREASDARHTAAAKAEKKPERPKPIARTPITRQTIRKTKP